MCQVGHQVLFLEFKAKMIMIIYMEYDSDEYVEYKYNDTYTFTQLYFISLFKFICKCFRKKDNS